MPALMLIALLLLTLNAVIFHQATIGLVALPLWLVAVGVPLGKKALPTASPVASILLGALLALGLLALGGTALYYFFPVTTVGLLLVIFAVSTLALVFWRKSSDVEPSNWRIGRLDASLLALGLTGLVAWWAAIGPEEISEAVRSPWAQVSAVSVLALGITGCAAALSAFRGSRAVTAILVAGILFSITSMAATVYPLGFGFDPFLHRATVEHIVTNGTITPKPLYYIGQYALELAGTKIFALPLAAVDVFLAPALLALAAMAIALNQQGKAASSLALLFLPFAGFIPTTPQALGYVWTLATVFAVCFRSGQKPAARWLGWLFGAVALVTHPIAGIPTVLFLMTAALIEHKQRAATIVLVTSGAVALPAVFLIQATIFGLDADWSPNLNLAELPLSAFFGTGFNVWLDALYFIAANALWVLLALALIRGRREKLQTTERALWLTVGMLAVNFIVLSLSVDFSFLISYEQHDFAARLLILMPFFLVPLVGNTLARFADRIPSLSFATFFLVAGLFGLATSAGAYAAYPRHDGYARSAGFNITQTDIDAVHAINRRESDDAIDYVVLANQAVSAAAVQEFGFTHYFTGDVFYYPIPTGGTLYSAYLAMVDEAATQENAVHAMDLAGVDTAYFVVNDYWWQSDKIIAQAKREAEDWFALGEGAVTVFIFLR